MCVCVCACARVCVFYVCGGVLWDRFMSCLKPIGLIVRRLLKVCVSVCVCCECMCCVCARVLPFMFERGRGLSRDVDALLICWMSR